MTDPESLDRVGHAIRAQLRGAPTAERARIRTASLVFVIIAIGVVAAIMAKALWARNNRAHMPPAAIVPGGDAARGQQAFAGIGCGFCHTVRGERTARGKVGPPLDGMAERTFIAGQVPNTPDNLVRWIRDPQSIERGTAMPNLGVDDHTARDIAAWLYTRR
jgi:cytochrome c2